MSENINDLTIQYEEDGKVLTKELDKVILSNGAWATLIFRYKTWLEKNQDFSNDKYVIQRYQKVDGMYKRKSKFNISSQAQGEKIVAALTNWMKD